MVPASLAETIDENASPDSSLIHSRLITVVDEILLPSRPLIPSIQRTGSYCTCTVTFSGEPVEYCCKLPLGTGFPDPSVTVICAPKPARTIHRGNVL